MSGKHRSRVQQYRKYKYLLQQREWRKVKKDFEYEHNQHKWAIDTVNRLCQNNTVSRNAIKNLFTYCSSNGAVKNDGWVLVCRLDEWRKNEDGEKYKQPSDYYLEVSYSNYRISHDS